MRINRKSRIALLSTVLIGAALACGMPGQSVDVSVQIAQTQTALAFQSMMLLTQQAMAAMPQPTNTQPAPPPATEPPAAPATEAPPQATATNPVPFLVATMDVNCRFGPDIVYDDLDYLMTGEQANIEGKDKYDNWWLITTPGKGKKCWVWSGAVKVTGDTSSVPVITPPPTPTPESLGSIYGYAWVDSNNNGNFEPAESALSGAIFFLRSGTCPGGDVINTTQSTGGGYFIFKDLPVGKYCVQHDPSQETLTPKQQNVTLVGPVSMEISFRRLP